MGITQNEGNVDAVGVDGSTPGTKAKGRVEVNGARKSEEIDGVSCEPDQNNKNEDAAFNYRTSPPKNP